MTGLTTAATLFVVASVGMAAGGGLYLTACFATVMILIALVLLGRMERAFLLKAFVTTYEVKGRNVDAMLREVNNLLDSEQLTMHSVHIASADPDFRWCSRWNASTTRRACFPSACMNRPPLPP